MRYALAPGNPGIVLTEATLRSILHYRQKGIWAREAGGQLFATFEGAETIIHAATKPSRLDLRTRLGFKPNLKQQRSEIEANYKKGLHYVGSWHSHPEPIPVPSALDCASMITNFLRSSHDLKGLIMIIVGTAPLPRGVFVALVRSKEVLQLFPDSGLDNIGTTF